MRAKPKSTITHKKQERKFNCFNINLLDVQKIIQKLSKSSSQTLRRREEAAANLLTTATVRLLTLLTFYNRIDSE